MNRVGRADLLIFLERWGKEGLEQVAQCMRFYPRPKEPAVVKPKKEAYTGALPTTAGEAGLEHRFDEVEPKVRFWGAVEYREKGEEETRADEPGWLKETEYLVGGKIRADYSRERPAKIPLVPWSGMWPFLFGVLGYYCDTRSIDIGRVVDLVARAEPMNRLPFRQRLTWAGTCQIILDMDELLLPFWDDETRFLQRIEKFRGLSGMEVLVFENGPEGLCRRWGKELGEPGPYRLPGPGSPILVLSDLGCLDTDTAPRTRRQKAWLRFGKRLERAGFLPTALTLCPSRYWDTELARYWRLACWDRGGRLPRLADNRWPGGKAHHALIGESEPGVEGLLGLLSAAIRIEPGLLRAVRLLLPRWRADVGTEAAAWGHEHVHASPIAFAFDKDTIQHYRGLFKDNPIELKERVIALIKKHHAHLSPAVRALEDMIAGTLLEWDEKQFEESEGTQFMKQVVKTQDDKTFTEQEEMGQWLDRTPGHIHSDVWKKDGVLTAAWLIRNRKAWERGMLPLPPGMDIQKAAWIFGRKHTPVQWILRRKGDFFVLDRGGWTAGEAADGWNDRGSPAAILTMDNPILKVGVIDGGGANLDYALNVETRRPAAIPVPAAGRLMLDTGREQVALEALTGLDWATATGRDCYGLYADFSIKGVVQRMRLIIPGKFMMGSPGNEPERYDDETLHQVIISRGYWLADTACTQALWEAVTGENPSRFKGADRPVENVSWKDCREFIDTINGLEPGLNLRLPTEAEWEYACRAGTRTPFWFGENITPDQVNYNGKYPYAGGKKGKYREETVDVKSLPCNDWGLYQMHGNVDEWCSDWYDEYPSGSVIDPVGPSDGAYRVLRGGGWFSDGGGARSACRSGFGPSSRLGNPGLRLARGQKEKGLEGLKEE